MRKSACRLGLIALALAISFEGHVAFAQDAKDPFLGSWVLNRAESEFSANVPEKRMTIFTLVNGAIKQVTDTLQANGASDRVEYTAKYDGKKVPITNSVLATVSLKKIDANTVERTGYDSMGMEVETSIRKISADGKKLTIETNGINGDVEYSNTQVFDRVK